MSRRNVALFAGLCALAAVAIAVVIQKARTPPPPEAGALAASSLLTAEGIDVLRRSGAERIYFRHAGLGPHHGRLAYADAASPLDVTFVDDLSCEALYVAGGRGTCLSAARGVLTTYSAKLFDANAHRVYATIELAGVPSRTRVSRDGRYGATTVFVTGHGYDSVDFSTETRLIDMQAGASIAELETDFSVTRDGAVIQSSDFNFWGVTFTPDSRSFYATLSTGGEHLLIKGDIAARTAEVIHAGVECPSLSPDGTRVAYKKRFVEGSRIVWRLHVLDLASRVETPLPETRSVDDQLEWLGNTHLLYSAPPPNATSGTYVWVVPVDGSEAPQVLARDAYSPSVVTRR